MYYEGMRSYTFPEEIIKGIDYNPSELNGNWWDINIFK